MAETAPPPADLDDDLDGSPLRRSVELPESEMDITPMIDVTFLLLIFFVVCSNIDSSSAIELAAAKNGQAVGERDCFIITVEAGGIDTAPVYLPEGSEQKLLSDDLEKQNEQIRVAIEEAKESDAKQDVLIKADRNVAHRDVARVIKAVSKVPDMRIHLAVKERD